MDNAPGTEKNVLTASQTETWTVVSTTMNEDVNILPVDAVGLDLRTSN